MRLSRLPAVLAALGLILPGCSSSRAITGAQPPPGPPVIDVTMREYQFVYRPPATSGRVVFKVVNGGREAHELSLVRLAEDVPPINEQLHGPTRRAVTPFARVPVQNPGGQDSFAVDLAPGQRYAMICFFADPKDGVSHALKGMSSEFRPGPRRPAP